MRKLFFLIAAMLFIYITKAQNVGIGIATPHALLHLHQASFPTLLFTNSTTGSLGTDGTALLLDGNNFILDNGENGSIIFSNQGAERLRITAAGNVGIGTTTPALAQLQVEGMVGNTVAMFKGSSGSKGISFVADWPGIFFNSYFNGGVKAMSASGYPSFINTEQSTGALTFNTTDVPNTVANDPVTVPERMRIAGNGYVGIGATTPLAMLHVSDEINSPAILAESHGYTTMVLNNSGFGTSGIDFKNNNVLNSSIKSSPAGDIFLQNNSGLIFMKANGNVGIGTSAPQAALDVSSTTNGFLPPRMTEVQRDLISPVAGLIIFNLTTQMPNYFDGIVWRNFDGTLTHLHTIGDSYQGGIIAYILQPGDPGYDANVQHGLIAAASDVQYGGEWGCWGTPINGAYGTAIGTGNQNTINIRAYCSEAGIAARICGDLVLNGYIDWYLPSKDELNKLYLNRSLIGVFAPDIYWGSSEYDSDYAWIQNFGNGFQDYYFKYVTAYVRAVRAF